MVSSTFTRNTAAVGAVGLCGASLFGASAAVAAPVPCAYPGSTQVVTGVCQVVVTADGVLTFPSTLNKVTAILVGAGGGGYIGAEGDGAYGGGGGEVIYVDSVALDTAITVDIGSGGTIGLDGVEAGNGGDTLFGAATAHGGLGSVIDQGSHVGGVSGNGHTGILGGGGAAGDAPDSDTPGPGYLLSGVPGVDAALFPSAADPAVQYGRGGESDSSDAPGNAAAVPTNSGAGGSAYWQFGEVSTGEANPGADGVVIVRYAAASLAATGADSTGALIVGGLAVAGGAALVASAGAVRRRRSPK
ncbi:hypothetical protein BKA04_000611 [Cryobacterium mesophilum]|uniref:Glycine-rich domain-containing protein n=1 Tax=Terrimesophilobacter mesophilus TaxID=433647 RepID=A0A4R8V9M6_9MICO|nr:hypothetical protein [Terrimesophilobacter mesophilus]MBB5632388.1 hypothetical protein [Terrimesophilobacter mesophilus]TFB79225.1 hypothetical protein E3N84_03640 [Terrimesophilobacter mesophilus]